MEKEKYNSLKTQFDIIISQLEYLTSVLEKEKLTNEQIVLDFYDRLNAISVKH